MRYDTLLLDADNTLFDFEMDQHYAIIDTFSKYDIPYSQEAEELYSRINRAMWTAYENGEIPHHEIIERRFRCLFERMGYTGEYPGFEEEYQLALGRGGYLLPEALDVCRQLCEGGHHLYLATNGLEKTQNSRLDVSGLRPYLSGVFISDIIGSQKPQKSYFDYIAAHIPDWDSGRALMVGDSLNSDMRGGENAGIDTCWFNPERKVNTAGVKIDYEITNLADLISIAG